MADKFDSMARIAGAAGGLNENRWPGLAMIFRQIAYEEREACALIADTSANPKDPIHEQFEPALNEARKIAKRIRERSDQQ